MSNTFIIDKERSRRLRTDPARADLARFSRFVSLIWQVNPFQEGNTRTVAVLAALYLPQLGFDVGNEPFEYHTRFFRDALARANYRNAPAGVLPDASFVERFLGNLVNGADYPLDREDLVCPALFEHPELLRNVSPSLALRKSAGNNSMRSHPHTPAQYEVFRYGRHDADRSACSRTDAIDCCAHRRCHAAQVEGLGEH